MGGGRLSCPPAACRGLRRLVLQRLYLSPLPYVTAQSQCGLPSGGSLVSIKEVLPPLRVRPRYHRYSSGAGRKALAMTAELLRAVLGLKTDPTPLPDSELDEPIRG